MSDAIAELEAIARKLLKAGDVALEVIEQLGEECVDLIKAGHSAGQDPYGDTWQKKADGGASHLWSSGNLRNGWHVSSLDSSHVTVSPTAFYAAVHQGGKTITAKTSRGLRFKLGGRWVTKRSVRIPARPMVPDGRGLPPAWADALKATAERVLEEKLGGK